LPSSLALYRSQRSPTDADVELEPVRSLTADEERAYLAALDHLRDFALTRDLIALVSANLEEVRKKIDLATTQIQDEGRRPRTDSVKLRRAIQLAVINYLNAVRLYLDHRETHLTRRYGAQSAPLAAFNTTRRSLHDSEPTYRFVYELRNFVQHCGMPLQVLRESRRLVSDGGQERAEGTLFIGCGRDELLARFDGWRHSDAWLQSQPEEFPILPLLEEMTTLLRQVERATVEAILVELWLDAKLVVSLLAEATDESTDGTVASYGPSADESGEGTLSITMPPLSILGWLRLIRVASGGGYQINTEALRRDSPPQVS
jgi:hypothetical protein